MDELRRLFCKNLKHYRSAKGLTQFQMAEQLGMALSSYRNYEYGVSSPNLERLEELSQKLEVGIADFFRNINHDPIKEESEALDSKDNSPVKSQSDFFTSEELIKIQRIDSFAMNFTSLYSFRIEIGEKDYAWWVDTLSQVKNTWSFNRIVALKTIWSDGQKLHIPWWKEINSAQDICIKTGEPVYRIPENLFKRFD